MGRSIANDRTPKISPPSNVIMVDVSTVASVVNDVRLAIIDAPAMFADHPLN